MKRSCWIQRDLECMQKVKNTISLMFGNWQVFSRCKNGCLKTCPESQVERIFPLMIVTSSISLR